MLICQKRKLGHYRLNNKLYYCSIDKYGKYYLNSSDNNIALLPQQLMNRVAAELAIAKQNGKSITVLVKGDQAVSYAKVVQAMVLLQHAGIKQVGLMTVDLDSSSAKTQNYRKEINLACAVVASNK